MKNTFTEALLATIPSDDEPIEDENAVNIGFDGNSTIISGGGSLGDHILIYHNEGTIQLSNMVQWVPSQGMKKTRLTLNEGDYAIFSSTVDGIIEQYNTDRTPPLPTPRKPEREEEDDDDEDDDDEDDNDNDNEQEVDPNRTIRPKWKATPQRTPAKKTTPKKTTTAKKTTPVKRPKKQTPQRTPAKRPKRDTPHDEDDDEQEVDPNKTIHPKLILKTPAKRKATPMRTPAKAPVRQTQVKSATPTPGTSKSTA